MQDWLAWLCAVEHEEGDAATVLEEITEKVYRSREEDQGWMQTYIAMPGTGNKITREMFYAFQPIKSILKSF